MVKCQNQEDIRILRNFINIWRREDMENLKKRREDVENIPHRNPIGKKKPCK